MGFPDQLENWCRGQLQKKSQHILRSEYRHTSEILQIWFQTTTLKHMLQKKKNKSNEFVGFPAQVKVVFTV